MNGDLKGVSSAVSYADLNGVSIGVSNGVSNGVSIGESYGVSNGEASAVAITVRTENVVKLIGDEYLLHELVVLYGSSVIGVA